MTGDGSLLLISGEAGSGKTRLSEELKRAAKKANCEVLTGRCILGAPVPLLAFKEALAKYGPMSPVQAMAVTGQYKDEVFLHTLEFLTARSSQGAMLVHLEDIHWADSQSLHLMHFLARNLRASRVMMVATYRPDEANSNGGQLREVLREMRREGLVHEIALEPLKASEIYDLVRSVIAGDVEAPLLSKIARVTGGNPLFTIEVVNLLQSRGEVVNSLGVWKSVGQIDICLPPTVRELVLRNFETLEDQERRTLEYASSLGESFDPFLVADMLGQEQMTVLDSLDRISSRTYLVHDCDSRFCFRHETVRWAIYDGISVTRRASIHRLAGEAIERHSPNEEDAIRLSNHFFLGKDDQSCLMYSLRAGSLLLSSFNFPEALEFFRRAEALATKLGNQDLLNDANEGLGDAYYNQGYEKVALDFYSRMVPKDARQKARFIRKKAWCHDPTTLGKGDPTVALEMIREVESIEGADEMDIALARKEMGFFLMFNGQFDEAVGTFSDTETVLLKNGDMASFTECLVWHAEALLSMGRPNESRELVQKNMGLVEGRSVQWSSDLAFNLGLIEWHLGNSPAALDHFVQSRSMAVKIGDAAQVSMAYLYESMVHDRMGNVEAARRSVLDSLEALRDLGIPYLRARLFGFMAYYENKLGNQEEAVRLLSKGKAFLEGYSTEFHSITTYHMALFEAEIAAKGGDWARSELLYTRAIKLAHGAAYGYMYEAIGLELYGEQLINRGATGDAMDKLNMAIALYDQLGNETDGRRLRDRTASL